MHLAIIGATGNVGRRLVDEALERQHRVTAIARSASGLAVRPALDRVDCDVQKAGALAAELPGHDAIISAVGFRQCAPELLIDAVRRSKVPRYLVVGGAGSLQVAPGLALVDAPGFPEEYRAEALAGKTFLDTLRGIPDLGWTFLSPSALFLPGERTGRFRLGDDTLLADAQGKSWISFEDYAVAALDEIESPRHTGRRFTVGY